MYAYILYNKKGKNECTCRLTHVVYIKYVYSTIKIRMFALYIFFLVISYSSHITADIYKVVKIISSCLKITISETPAFCLSYKKLSKYNDNQNNILKI